jgi:hypothetical protein
LALAKPIPASPAYEPKRNEQKKDVSAVSPLPRRARTQQLAKDQAQVKGSHVDQLPLQNIFVAAQVRAPHATGVIAMREAAFHQFAAPPE